MKQLRLAPVLLCLLLIVAALAALKRNLFRQFIWIRISLSKSEMTN
ncbi:MAG: hypothetical protein ACR2JB_05860 [Bryobacteraceae bacterium]